MGITTCFYEKLNSAVNEHTRYLMEQDRILSNGVGVRAPGWDSGQQKLGFTVRRTWIVCVVVVAMAILMIYMRARMYARRVPVYNLSCPLCLKLSTIENEDIKEKDPHDQQLQALLQTDDSVPELQGALLDCKSCAFRRGRVVSSTPLETSSALKEGSGYQGVHVETREGRDANLRHAVSDKARLDEGTEGDADDSPNAPYTEEVDVKFFQQMYTDVAMKHMDRT